MPPAVTPAASRRLQSRRHDQRRSAAIRSRHGRTCAGCAAARRAANACRSSVAARRRALRTRRSISRGLTTADLESDFLEALGLRALPAAAAAGDRQRDRGRAAERAGLRPATRSSRIDGNARRHAGTSVVTIGARSPGARSCIEVRRAASATPSQLAVTPDAVTERQAASAASAPHRRSIRSALRAASRSTCSYGTGRRASARRRSTRPGTRRCSA